MTPLIAANSLDEYFRGDWPIPFTPWTIPVDETWALVLAAIVHVLLVIHFFAVAPLVFIWLERKVAGRIQDRLGPTRVGGRFGWLQTLADGLKLIQKEDLCPDAADRFLFRVSPYLVFVASFGAFIVLPFSNGWAAQVLDVGLFFMLAVMSLEVIGVILAGYSSGSKWALFGGMREAAQVVSYEIPMAICTLIPVVAAGSLNLVEIGEMQSGWFSNWLVFNNPFTFLAFFVYFTVATASVKRAPFDLAEAESELVAGFHTEYSGIRWSYFFMAEYGSMFGVSGIAVILFLGGWQIGVPVLPSSMYDTWIGGYIANLIGLGVFVSKSCALVFLQIWVRWTLPRLRIDQVMMTCLKYLLPISCFLFLGAIVWPLSLAAMTGRTTLLPVEMGGQPLGNKLYRQPAEVTRKAEPASPATALLNRGGRP
jgi:NADH-quinone oxidoreductase subunit H